MTPITVQPACAEHLLCARRRPRGGPPLGVAGEGGSPDTPKERHGSEQGGLSEEASFESPSAFMDVEAGEGVWTEGLALAGAQRQVMRVCVLQFLEHVVPNHRLSAGSREASGRLGPGHWGPETKRPCPAGRSVRQGTLS